MTTYSSAQSSIKSFFNQRSALSKLILVNISVYLLINIIDLGFWLFKVNTAAAGSSLSFPAYWLSVPADGPHLILRPWGLITYMFVHYDFFHILFNMLILYFAGQIFVWLLNEKKLVSTYILGGLSGSLFFIASYNLFPVFKESLHQSVAVGASASVLSILVAAAAYSPNHEINLLFIGKVKLKYVALVLILMDVLSISRENPGGHIAHLGGAAWGFLYIKYFQNRGLKMFNGFRLGSLLKRKRSFKKQYGRGTVVNDEEYNARKHKNQQKIDKILEKISRHGYEGLTKKEKEILFKAGKK